MGEKEIKQRINELYAELEILDRIEGQKRDVYLFVDSVTKLGPYRADEWLYPIRKKIQKEIDQLWDMIDED